MTLTIFTGPLSTLMQDVFRETYRSHYEDEYQKVQRYLKRHYYRVVTLLLLSIFTFFVFSQLASLKPDETLVTYIIGNISCFCLWEVGYTQFATRDVIDEKKRILRARDAVIGFQCHEDHEN